MTARHSLLSLLVSSFLGCGPEAVHPLSTAAITTSAADAGDSPGDAGVADPFDGGVDQDAGVDAGASGPNVPVFLTGTAAATWQNSLIAGAGVQPVLQAFVAVPRGAVCDDVQFTRRSLGGGGDGGGVMTTTVSTPTNGDAGLEYELPLDTTTWPEGATSVIARADCGDAGFKSNPLTVLVDRTPPELGILTSFDGGAVARDAKLQAGFAADDDGGSGIADMTISVGGVQAVAPFFSETSVPVWLESSGTYAVGVATIDLSTVPFDAWSTAKDGAEFIATFSATDRAGNTASQKIRIPATRQLWVGQAAGLSSLGPNGQVLVNSTVGLMSLSPTDGTLQAAVDFLADPVGAPETLVAGDGFSVSYALMNGSNNGTVASIDYAGGSATSPLQGLYEAMAIGTQVAEVLLVSQTCQATPLNNQSGSTWTGLGSLCRSPSVAIDGSQFYAAADGNVTTGALLNLNPTATSVGYGPLMIDQNRLYAASINATLAVNMGTPPNLLLVPQGVGSTALSLISDATGAVYTLDGSGDLSKLGGWSGSIAQGPFQTSIAVGAPVVASAASATADGRLVYAVDGTGALEVFDDLGRLRWTSPVLEAVGTPVIDPCTSHLFIGTISGTLGIAVDSPGVDAAPGAWPMPGHDVFQTFDASNVASVDCEAHL